MIERFSRLLDWLSNNLAHRKGLLPLIGVLLVGVNLIITLAFPGPLAESNLLLHLGVIIAILGFMLAWAL